MHEHTKDCYKQTPEGALVYRPCREDGLDRNMQVLVDIDFEAGVGLRGLTLICTEDVI